MLKDFSQEFEKESTSVGLLIEDARTGDIICIQTKDGIEDFGKAYSYTTMSLELKAHTPFINQIAAELYKKGLSLISLRELVRNTSVSFSLVDNTPGNQKDMVWFYTTVDIVDKDLSKNDLVKLPFKKAIDSLLVSELKGELLAAALSPLILERELDHSKEYPVNA